MPMDPQIEDRKVAAMSTTLLIDVSADDQLSSASDDLSSRTVVGLLFNKWVDDTIDFKVNYDGGSTYYPLYNADGLVQITSPGTQASGFQLALDPSDFAGVRYLKVNSTTDSTQNADVTITVLTRGVA